MLHTHRWDLISVIIIGVIAIIWIISLTVKIRRNKGSSSYNRGRVVKPKKIKHFTDKA